MSFQPCARPPLSGNPLPGPPALPEESLPLVDPVGAALMEIKGALDPAAAEGPLRRLREALRGADALETATARESAIAALRGKSISSPAGRVDAAIGSERAPARESPAVQGTALALADLEPWPEPVEGAVLLRDIADTFSRYVSLPPHAADAMALWAIHAHSLNAATLRRSWP